ncbi:MAG: ATP-binding cassette domain-containing protein [Byssovorax sp.]
MTLAGPDRAETGRLAAAGVIVVREGRTLVDRADLAVNAGEIAVVEGASGSGKTTMLRAMATLIPRDAGTLTLDGIDAAALPPTHFRRRVAYVPQLPPMLEGTVADNVATGPRLRGASIASEALAALVIRVGLPEAILDRPARELSGGERQRVALARALANEPSFLLMDEPTSALDPASATHVLALVRALAEQGLGVLVVTHVEEHAERLGGTRYTFVAGRIAARG